MATFVPDVLLVLAETPKNKFGQSSQITVTRWIVDGKVNKPKFGKREFYLDREGNERNKSVDMTEAEGDMIVARWPEIKKLLANPPEYVAPAAAAGEEF